MPAAPHHAAINFHCIFGSVKHVPRVRAYVRRPGGPERGTVTKPEQTLPDDS